MAIWLRNVEDQIACNSRQVTKKFIRLEIHLIEVMVHKLFSFLQGIMSRIRDEPDAMLMNEWGFFFEETTATSLVKV